MIHALPYYRRSFPGLLYCLLCFLPSLGWTQQPAGTRWWNPFPSSPSMLGGRYWQKDLKNDYDRLPARAAQTTRPAVYELSHQCAGEYLEFSTAAPAIFVRYQVTGSLSMPHMPATGVSGVDLYAQDAAGNWHWASGRYAFGDTIQYRFASLANTSSIRRFRLYLPLYNQVSWLEIGVPATDSIRPLQPAWGKPIVLYGTSILQGACASRPGMAWTNILGRRLNIPLINLGFSGNGQLEPAVIDLINDIDASLFVLDCMPNLVNQEVFTRKEITKRIMESVASLRGRHPRVPILLVEHAGGLPLSNLDTALRNQYKRSSEVLEEAYAILLKRGVRQVFLLKDTDIGLDQDATVDGTHPNDYGMIKYADAYEKAVARILALARAGR